MAGLPGTRRLRLVAAVGAVLTGVLVLAQADLLATVLADPAAARRTTLGWLAAVFAGRVVVGVLRDRGVDAAAADVKRRLRSRVLAALPRTRRPDRLGELATLAGPGLDGMDAELGEHLPQRALAAVLPVAVLARVLLADPVSALVIGVTLPLVPVFGVLIGRHTKAAAAGQWRALGALGGHFLDVLRGLPTLRAFGRAEHQVGVVRRTAQAYRAATMRALRIAFLSALALETVAALSVALVAVPVGLRLLDGTLDLRTGLLVLLLAPEAYLPLRAVGSAFHAAAAGRAATTRAVQIAETAEPAEYRGRTGGGFALCGVSASYGGNPVLHQISLTVHSGQHVALLGPSGAGKSTLLAVLLGLLAPTAGTVGVGSRRVAWVPQRPHLFTGTVRDNVTLGAPGADDRAVLAALTAASAGFVADLPDGLDTVLGERGLGLSVGQRQRIALARAFLVDADLVVLDEPTAGLDAVAEAEVAAATRRLMRGRTVLLATHRAALLESMDRVLALDNGRIACAAW